MKMPPEFGLPTGQRLLRAARTVAGLLLAALAAVVTLNAVALAQGGCTGAWGDCLPSFLPFVMLEYALALPFAAIAGLLFLALRSLGLLAVWHLAVAGALVSVLGGAVLGVVSTYAGVLLFIVMGAVSALVFRAVVMPRPATSSATHGGGDA